MEDTCVVTLILAISWSSSAGRARAAMLLHLLLLM
jgi:hypothetical protein